MDQIFLFPGLIWSAKRLSPADVITGGSQQPSSFVLGHFRHGGKQTPKCNLTSPIEYAVVWLFTAGLGASWSNPPLLTHRPNTSLSSPRQQRCKGPINTHRQRDGDGFNIYQTVGLTANTVYNHLRFVRKSQFNSFVNVSFYLKEMVVDLVKLWQVAAGQDKRTGHSWIRLV